MDHCVDAFKCTPKTVLIAHVAKKETQLGVLTLWVWLLKLPLLELVAAVHHQPVDLWKASKSFGDERLTKAAGAAGDRDARIGSKVHLNNWQKNV